MPAHLASAITMITTMIMTDAPGLMRLLTWLSPAFPTGAFAYSHGLEWAVETSIFAMAKHYGCG